MERPRLRRLGPGWYRTLDGSYNFRRFYLKGKRGGKIPAWEIIELNTICLSLRHAAITVLPFIRGHSGLAEDSGTVYLLHFERPFGHARHYLGWTNAESVESRIARHRAGNGANLMRHVVETGIGFELVRVWPGGRARERQLKRRGGGSRLCPICSPLKGRHNIRDQNGRFTRTVI